MAERFIDLHTHSLASDGTDSPREVAENAYDAGLAAFALTDHDTVSGVEEAMRRAQELGIECIPGCEIAVHEEGFEEVHILGLWVDWKEPELLHFLDTQLKNRLRRNEQIVGKLQGMGMDITLDEVIALSPEGACGRPHIARVLYQRGFVPDVRTAFARYLGKDGSAYVPRLLSTPEKGIRALAASGAIVAIAHPCTSSRMTPKKLNKLLKQYIPYGLNAIEAFHSVHTPFKQRLCLRMAGKYSLLVSGGSDDHGTVKDHAKIGFSHSGQRIPYRFLEAMKEWREERGLPIQYTLDGFDTPDTGSRLDIASNLDTAGTFHTDGTDDTAGI